MFAFYATNAFMSEWPIAFYRFNVGDFWEVLSLVKPHRCCGFVVYITVLYLLHVFI